MPRSLRVFVEGGIYHVYNRFASRESVFADPEEALEFIELLRYGSSPWVGNVAHKAQRSWLWPSERALTP